MTPQSDRAVVFLLFPDPLGPKVGRLGPAGKGFGADPRQSKNRRHEDRAK